MVTSIIARRSIKDIYSMLTAKWEVRININKRSVLRRQSRDTNRNIKWLVSL